MANCTRQALKARTQDVVAIDPATQVTAQDLSSYKRVELPQKFVHKTVTEELPTAGLPVAATEQVLPVPAVPLQPTALAPPQHEPMIREVGMSMNDVLMAQSSSRLKLKK